VLEKAKLNKNKTKTTTKVPSLTTSVAHKETVNNKVMKLEERRAYLVSYFFKAINEIRKTIHITKVKSHPPTNSLAAILLAKKSLEEVKLVRL
jgi:hypothetical protein